MCQVADRRSIVAKVQLEIPSYDHGIGLVTSWPDDYRLSISVDPDGKVRVVGDSGGLTGLAVQLLALAQPGVPAGAHEDLDDFLLVLDEGSAPLRIERA
jgi:hypothetical protein